MAEENKYKESNDDVDEKYKKYLEGNYDGDAEQKAKQKKEDIENAKKMTQEVETEQKKAYADFEQEIKKQTGITDKRFEQLMDVSDKKDKLHQYLVDGAILTCTMTSLDDFEVDDETLIQLPTETSDEGEKRRQMSLRVMENPMYIDGLYYATVKDTIINENIFPFRCNCSQKADRQVEVERIKENLEDCRENGVCKYLMCLNEEWDNMLLSSGTSYQKRRDIKAYMRKSAGAGWILGGGDIEGEEEEGITRTSVLFCKHGGLIVPVTSGQVDLKDSCLGIRDSTRLLIKELEGDPFVKPRINKDGSFTVGYGYDFTETSDPESFSKYFRRERNNIVVARNLTKQEVDDSIDLAADKKNITEAIDNFIDATGYGNEKKPLILNQNQYDALFSYFYSNGAYVFTEEVYEKEINKGGKYKVRAEARKKLRDYIIDENGNYNANEVKKLFVNSKGGNIAYDYKERREKEAEVFMQGS